MSKQTIDHQQIKWGQVWKLEGYPRQHFVVLGNCWLDDGTIWLANMRTGEKVYGHKDAFVFSPRRINDLKNERALHFHLSCFASKGQAHVMDWLGWFFEGKNDKVALLYYIAAMRKDHGYSEFAGRIISDLCLSQESDIDSEFCSSIPELANAIKYRKFKLGSNWLELVQQAIEIAYYSEIT